MPLELIELAGPEPLVVVHPTGDLPQWLAAKRDEDFASLLPALDEASRNRMRHDKKARHAEICRRALESMDEFLAGGERQYCAGNVHPTGY